MGDLTTNISRSEMECECGCGFNTADFELINALQDTVDHFGHCYILITGPNRCKKHNDELRKLYDETNGEKGAKTAPKSQHIYGRGADFKLYDVVTRVQIDPDIVYDYLNDKYSGKFGLGLYSNRVHLDTRSGGCARWGV